MSEPNSNDGKNKPKLRLIRGNGIDSKHSRWDDFVSRQRFGSQPWIKAAVMGSRRPDVAGTSRCFYTEEDVCRRLSLAPHVLRYWESEFPQLAPIKNRAGQRIYRPSDVRKVFRIWELLHEEQLSLAGVRERIEREFGKPDGSPFVPKKEG
jgi:hypothetical protein